MSRMCLALTVLFALAWAAPAPAQTHKTPRTWFGAPDLQGYWTNGWLTGMERPKEFPSLVIDEAAALTFEREFPEMFTAPDPEDVIGQAISEWWEPGAALARIRGVARSSWIYEPADGKIPWREEVAKANAARGAAEQAEFDNPEGRTMAERCMHHGSGPPFRNQIFSNVHQITQTRDHVVIHSEFMHVARIIRIGVRPRTDGVRVWNGDSVGRWDGSTLVVETTNFHPLQVGSPVDTKVVERITRTSKSELHYEFSVENPALYTRIWRGEMIMRPSPTGPIEYACHEGNYGFENILAGARQTEGTLAPSN